jgi:hypothetical protein
MIDSLSIEWTAWKFPILATASYLKINPDSFYQVLSDLLPASGITFDSRQI